MCSLRLFRLKRWGFISVLFWILGFAGPAASCAEERVPRIEFGTAPVSNQFNRAKIETIAIDSIAVDVRSSLGVPSFSIGVVHRDRLVYAKSFGDRCLSNSQPASPETLYHVGSVSKGITSSLLMILLHRGVLALDDPISDYLPDSVEMPTFRGAPEEITVRQLASHTSGLRRDPPNRRNVWHGFLLNPGQAKAYSTDELYKAVSGSKLEFEPGLDCRYSNYGFGLLGHVMERAAGKPLERLFKEELFHPLGMNDTTVQLDEEARELFATHYWADDKARPRKDRPETPFGEVFAHGGIVSSVNDLAKLISFHFGAANDSLPTSGVSLVQEPQLNADGEPFFLERDGVAMQMALGWRVQNPGEAGGIVNHSGEMDGHSAYVAFAPQSQVGVIVLANLGGASRSREDNPTAAVELGVKLKEMILYPSLGWKLGSD
ncbi:MAG: serine hydrolase domain-containing protein [Verrucomicrobiota bacterium]